MSRLDRDAQGRGARRPSVYALHARLAQLFSDAAHDGIIARNPCSRRTSPGTGTQRPYVATTKQVWALYDHCPPKIRPAILLAAHAGLRLAEVAALRPRTSTSCARDLAGDPVGRPPFKSDISSNPIPIPKELALILSRAVAGGDGGRSSATQTVAGGRTLDDRARLRAAREQVRAAQRLPVPGLRHYSPRC